MGAEFIPACAKAMGEKGFLVLHEHLTTFGQLFKLASAVFAVLRVMLNMNRSLRLIGLARNNV